MLEVVRAGDVEKTIIANLMELYMYDLSKIVPDNSIFKLDKNGRFGYPRFDSFWEDADRAAYLFRDGDAPLGFCLVHSSSFYHKDEGAKVIGEFFVLNSCRNKGIGTLAASKVMQLQPGYWEMRVIDINKVAVHFWEKVLRKVAANNYKIYEKYDYQWIGKVYVGKVS